MSADGLDEALRALRGDVEASLTALVELGARKRPPGRREARALLVPLGFLVIEAPAQDQQGLLERVRAVTEPMRTAWSTAVDDELRLAGEEYRQSIDPHYLSMPNYDLDYTLQARDRLEARLVAAAALGHVIPQAVLDGVRAADSLLTAFLDRQSQDDPASRQPPV